MECNDETAENIIVWLNDDTTHGDRQMEKLDETQSPSKDTDACRFNDPDQCLDFITDLPETSHVLLLVTSRKLMEKCVPLILDIPQIKEIYPFCLDNITSNSDDAVNGQNIFQHSSKVQNIIDMFTQFLCGSPVVDSSSPSNNNLPFELQFSQQLVAALTAKCPTSYHNIRFVYMRVFYRILVRYDQTDSNARHDMLAYLRQRFESNPKQLAIINEFDQTFPSTITAIAWYKRPTFHHEVVNEALFNRDPEVLYRMRFFIRQLEKELMKLCEEQQWNKKQDTIMVYRGTCMDVHEVYRWTKNKPGHVVHFDNFLSTSQNLQVGQMFAESACDSDKDVSTLLKITIPPFAMDTNMSRCLFANIILHDNPDHEEEILFSTGALFHMGKVEMTLTPHISCTLPLTLTHDLDFDDEQIKNFILYLKTKYDRVPFTLVAISHMMLEMGDYDLAEIFITQLIHQSATSRHLIGPAFSLLGQMYVKLEDYVRAFCVLEQALKYLSRDDSWLSSDTWAALGQVHLNHDEFGQALICTRRALECAETPEQIIYRKQKELDEAKSHLSRAHMQLRTHLPGKHPAWIEYYKQMGEIHLSQENISDACLMFLAAVHDPTMILPSQCLSIVTISRQMADICKRMGNSTMAEMISTVNMMIVQEFPSKYKAVQEAEDQYKDILYQRMNLS